MNGKNPISNICIPPALLHKSDSKDIIMGDFIDKVQIQLFLYRASLNISNLYAIQ